MALQKAELAAPRKMRREVPGYSGIEKDAAIEFPAYRGLKHKMEATDCSLHRTADAPFLAFFGRRGDFTSSVNSFLSAGPRDFLSRWADWDQSAKRVQNAISLREVVPSAPERPLGSLPLWRPD